MTREQIDLFRRTITSELLATGWQTAVKAASTIDSNGFYGMRCKGHDESEGGRANFCLWTLWFAREACRYLYPGFGNTTADTAEGCQAPFEPEALTMACLAADYATFAPSEALQTVVESAQQQAIAFCDSFPFGTEPLGEFEPVSDDSYVDIVFDQDDHRMWIGSSQHTGVFDGSESLSEFPVHKICYIPLRACQNAPDITLLSDDAGSYALMFLSEDSSEASDGQTPLLRSDRTMFGYTDLVFMISRFPQYRSSYIAARNAKGRWGVLRVRENKKNNGDHRILLDKVVDYTFRDPYKALDSMMSKCGGRIKVRHPHFYTEIKLSR